MQKIRLDNSTSGATSRGSTYKRSTQQGNPKVVARTVRPANVKKSSNSSSRGCSTTEKRNAYPYRRVYFEKNPGLAFGHFWRCSQCGRIIFSKKNVYVDHIIPLNKGGVNHHLNCVAICRTCNLKKSDKVDHRVAVGYASKALETTVLSGKKAVKFAGKSVFKSVLFAGKGFITGAKTLVSRGTSGIFILLAAALIIAYLINNFI